MKSKKGPSMSDQSSELSGTAQQINDLFDLAELSNAIETAEFKQFLDHIPIAIVVSKYFRGDQRICYANKASETLLGQDAKDCAGKGWSILAGFKDEHDANVTLEAAMLKGGEEFLGTFRAEPPRPLLVEAFSGLIQKEDGSENYRIAALIDITDRARAEREEYARRIRDKDILLRELQHRVKNNLQLIVALIRLEARNERRGGSADLQTLAGRIESLHLLYQALSNDAAGEEIDLGHYLSQIAAAVMNTCAVDGIRLEQKMEPAPVSVNTALSVGLVVNEVLTNSFKHAFNGRGHGVITIECLRQGEERHRVVVADDGVGLPKGVTWPIPGKIGALIVQTLRENTKADFSVVSAPEKGVRVTMNVDRNVVARDPV
jgi:PAS domain S-box-containing protein